MIEWIIEAMARAITFWATLGGNLPWWTPLVAVPLAGLLLAIYVALVFKLDELRDNLTPITDTPSDPTEMRLG